MTRSKLLATAGVGLVLILGALFYLDWFTIKVHSEGQLGASLVIDVDLRNAHTHASGLSVSVSLPTTDNYTKVAHATFWAALGFVASWAVALYLRLASGGGDSAIRSVVKLFGVATVIAAGTTNFISAPSGSASVPGASMSASAGWGFWALMVGMAVAYYVLRANVADEPTAAAPASVAAPRTGTTLPPATVGRPPVAEAPAPRGGKKTIPPIPPRTGGHTRPPAIDRMPIPVSEVVAVAHDPFAPPPIDLFAPMAEEPRGRQFGPSGPPPITLPEANDATMLSGPPAAVLEMIETAKREAQARAAAGLVYTAPTSAPIGLTGAIKFAAATIELTDTTVASRREDSGTRTLELARIKGIIVRRMPLGAPYEGTPIIDLFHRGEPIRITPWTRVAGAPLVAQAITELDHVRQLALRLRERCERAQFDKGTAAFVAGERDAPPTLADAEELATYDARFA